VEAQRVDVVVVGAGFGGLRALYTFRGLGFSVRVLEAGADIGGVWNFNRYPGARCDVESYDYSYMFSEELEQEWRWTERYATQPEVLRYIRFVADKFDLRRNIEVNCRVVRAAFNDESSTWSVFSANGQQWVCRYLIMAVGQLSTTKLPEFARKSSFRGDIYHSGEWPHTDIDFSGKSVGIIGTGSSGVQMTPIVASQAKHLAVFQRTANFSVPAANAPINDEDDARVKASYRQRRERALNSPSGLGFAPNKQSALQANAEERRAVYEAAWQRLGFGFALAYYDILLNEKANETAAEFIRDKIAEKVIEPNIRGKLTPRGFPFGTKRPSVDSGYFETFNRDNVTLVDVEDDPIVALSDVGIKTHSKEYPLDVIIFATGFDAFTGSLLRPEITGCGGQSLKEKWSSGPLTYLGLSVSGFPNMFIIAGPGSPSLLSNVILSIEQHVDWIAAVLMHARQNNVDRIDAKADAERKWVEHVADRAKETLYVSTKSYYSGDEIPGKPHVFMPYSGGVRGYRRILEKIASSGYEGFEMSSGKHSTPQSNAPSDLAAS
jgi:cyclohexanone monooxygenase